MGCAESRPQATLTEQYLKAGMLMPSPSEYSNEFEKQIFFAINTCRYEPKEFVPYVRAAAKHAACKGVPELIVKDLIEYLKKCEHLAPVSFDPQGTEAVRKNSDAVIEKKEEVPAEGGNMAAYKEVCGEGKEASCEEYTMVKYEGTEGREFVAIELIRDWAREGDVGKHSPILNGETKKVGISNKAHKTHVNLIQVLYIKEVINAME